MAEQTANKKTKIGVVVSEKMNKTRVIAVNRYLKHPLYNKFVKKTSKFMIHDEKNDSHEGDTIKVVETRPLSKNKRWRLIEIVERAK
ncbi:30S ribosomal protein S17 [candidate division KSB1 bacterium]|nr:30S ribosomal protein S17 [candidate division KSB1 bacterium]